MNTRPLFDSVTRGGCFLLAGGALLLLLAGGAAASEPTPVELARHAERILKQQCYRCHGQDGAVEGGFNYVLDLPKLVARKKVLPGDPDNSSLMKKIVSGKMPPPDTQPQPSDADIQMLRQWIVRGAAPTQDVAQRQPISDDDVHELILADLEKLNPSDRRFARYFTLTHPYNAGLSDDELQTYRHALSKLVNSLSWHYRVTVPEPIDPAKTVLRVDLRHYQWDANIWNRVLADYPYGVLRDSTVARGVAIATASRMAHVRADWFIATASRAPLYHDILALPANLAELERQVMRFDAATNIQQQRVARAGFNGSGVSQNNRLIERHDALHGAYWRTYDFEAVPQNLVERNELLPDPRNLFAYPLGPGFAQDNFQHVGGEVIFNLPNGLQGYMLVNAQGIRIDKAPTNIVSDPKRPDRAVETAVSCMGCHYSGINPKTDQIRAFVEKNAQAFRPPDLDLIKTLYVPEAQMTALMNEDTERFRKAVEKTGGKISAFEPIQTMTLRYEDDLDLTTAAAEVGVRAADLLERIFASEQTARNLGALKSPGGTVKRDVFVQAFAELARGLKLGVPLDPNLVAQSLPDNLGEEDPLEGSTSPATNMAFTLDGRRAAFTTTNRTVIVWDVGAGREIRRLVGHRKSVWSVAFSRDGRRLLSGGADHVVRYWDVETVELRNLQGHEAPVTAVAFSPDGLRAASGGYDHQVILWDLVSGREIRRYPDAGRFINDILFSSDGRRLFIAGDQAVTLIDVDSGQQLATFTGHTKAVNAISLSADGQRLLSGSDDGTLRMWDVAKRQETRLFRGHAGAVRAVAFAPDQKHVLSGGVDQTVRLWDADSGQELRQFTRHQDSVIRVAFLPDGQQTLSGSRDAVIRAWQLGTKPVVVPPPDPPEPVNENQPAPRSLPAAQVIRVGGIVTHLLLAPDGEHLYFLHPTRRQLVRVDTRTQKVVGTLPVAEGTDALSLTPDGKTLIATSPKGPQGQGLMQVIDARTWKLLQTFPIAAVPFDVAAADDGKAFVSGAQGGWTDVAVVDWKQQRVLARWGGVWNRSFLQLAPAQDRLYLATQGVTPNRIDLLTIPDRLDTVPQPVPSPEKGKHPFGGPIIISPDGQYLFSSTGTVLKLAAVGGDDLRFAVKLEPFLTAVVAPELGSVLTLAGDGSVRDYTYPGFHLRRSYRLGVVPYQAAYDARTGRLFVAAFDPATLVSRPRDPNLGDLYVYELKDVLTQK
ncbi:MAG: c-type cytochrome domain-containing protein [Gemmataceae bacterium]